MGRVWEWAKRASAAWSAAKFLFKSVVVAGVVVAVGGLILVHTIGPYGTGLTVLGVAAIAVGVHGIRQQRRAVPSSLAEPMANPLAERVRKLSREMYEFLEGYAGFLSGASAQAKVAARWRSEFEARSLALYPALLQSGLDPANLTFITDPVRTLEDIRRKALFFGTIAETLDELSE